MDDRELSARLEAIEEGLRGLINLLTEEEVEESGKGNNGSAVIKERKE